MEELAAVIKDYKGAKIIKQEPNYVSSSFWKLLLVVVRVSKLWSWVSRCFCLSHLLQTRFQHDSTPFS